NLPKADKMTEPQYRDIRAEAVPLVSGSGAKVRIVSGAYGGILGAVQGDYVKTLFLDVTLLPHAKWELATETGTTLFLYIVEGEAAFNEASGELIPARHAVLFNDGDQLFAQAGESGARFLLFCGRPLREPIAWGGPIVMNTQEELEQAFRELRNGTFIR
ncbi:MAG TPA: pirin-like C-terminal cupin domain-containing protein, partial [Clostridia bacterium]|nr:pirin-like C-terminal cupin domain-containing protein [Clostridia bacterium]